MECLRFRVVGVFKAIFARDQTTPETLLTTLAPAVQARASQQGSRVPEPKWVTGSESMGPSHSWDSVDLRVPCWGDHFYVCLVTSRASPALGSTRRHSFPLSSICWGEYYLLVVVVCIFLTTSEGKCFSYSDYPIAFILLWLSLFCALLISSLGVITFSHEFLSTT